MNNKLMVIAAVVAAGTIGVLGGTSLNSLQANAQEVTTAQNTTQSPVNTSRDESQATHTGSNGQKEELLTGDSAQKAKDAALKAVPGGTILRAETEADGKGVYEAHMTKSDGSRVTVYLDGNYNVTQTQDDAGHGGMRR